MKNKPLFAAISVICAYVINSMFNNTWNFFDWGFISKCSLAVFVFGALIYVDDTE
jgi:hypothetical protein